MVTKLQKLLVNQLILMASVINLNLLGLKAEVRIDNEYDEIGEVTCIFSINHIRATRINMYMFPIFIYCLTAILNKLKIETNFSVRDN